MTYRKLFDCGKKRICSEGFDFCFLGKRRGVLDFFIFNTFWINFFDAHFESTAF